MRTRRLLCAALFAAFTVATAAPGARAAALPPIGHVWVIVLENEGASTTFAPNTKAPYLARTLTADGAYVPNYYGIGHASLDNYVAMISGQGPNPDSQADCQFYQDIVPGTIGADGQAAGVGCVYPAAVQTIANQLDARKLAWRGYMEDIGNSTTQPTTCRHPDLNSQDTTQSASKGDQYAARHDPFVYFHSIIDNTVECSANVVGLDRLSEDLRATATTPSFSFITPNLCHDGHDSPCVDAEPGGLVSADQFLQTWVPQITASPAYQQDGLIAIIFDEASTSDTSSCCGEQAANTPAAGGTSGGTGGGKTGAVLLSSWIKPGTVTQTAYNHYSLLRSLEDLFGLAHLGYAAVDGLTPLGADVFTGSGPSLATTTPVVGCVSTTIGRKAKGRARPGELIASVSIVRPPRGTKPLLAVVAAHGTSLQIVAGGHRRGRRLRACQRYLFALSSAHGRLTLVATTGGLHERRSLRY